MEPPVRRRLLVGLVVLVAGGTMSLPGTAYAATASQEVEYRKITFPVAGATSYGNTWGASRDGGARQHEGTDIMGHKMQVLVAAHDGTIGWTRTDGNNMLTIRDDDGWEYWYIHINNDTPGTDDGANKPEHMFFPGIEPGVRVTAGQPVAYLGDSGNAEGTSPHLHFELHPPGGLVVNSYWSLMLAQGRRVNDRCGFDENPVLRASSVKTTGSYLTLTSDGGVYGYGGAPFFGAMAGKRLNAPAISLVPTPTGNGYWQLSADGGIFSFGGARFFGSTGAKRLNQPVVGMAATPSGNGYWLVARDGGIFSFGDARFAGSTGGMRLNQPIVGMAATPSGNGYWLVAQDGGIFSFGDAAFLGSTGGRSPSPVVDLTASPSGKGYWMLTRGGTVLPFGDAAFAGGTDRLGFCAVPQAVKLAPTSTGKGYWIQAADGNTFAFGDAPDQGSIKRQGLATRLPVDLAGF
jgi:hypothetical protein